jgi:septum formation protein
MDNVAIMKTDRTLVLASALVLASGSRFRRALLTSAGVDVTTIVPDVDENLEKIKILKVDPNISPQGLATALACVKAGAVSVKDPHTWVIGADQVLALGSRVFNKPTGRVEAAEHLAALSGQTHALHSAVCLVMAGRVVWQTVSTARLAMRPLNTDEIERYLDRCGPEIYGCVGAYQIEGLGAQLFDSIEGDYFTIIGLPLLPLLKALRDHAALNL